MPENFTSYFKKTTSVVSETPSSYGLPRISSGYSQPAEAPFSHDSVELANRAATLWLKEGPGRSVLDLCAGCGVVGLEAFVRYTERGGDTTAALSAIEIQEVYREHFERNRNRLAKAATKPAWLQMNYADTIGDVRFQSKFDWILSNPPYFEKNQGTLPPSMIKARSRFFLDARFEELWIAIDWMLRPGGSALVLCRDLADHGIERALQEVVSKQRLEWLEPIRGTGLVRYTKNLD